MSIFTGDADPDECRAIVKKITGGLEDLELLGRMRKDAVKLCSQADSVVHSCEDALRLAIKYWKEGRG